MKPFELAGKSEDGRLGSVWACGECLRTAFDAVEAERCCAPRLCNKCGGLAGEYDSGRPRMTCAVCQDDKHAAFEQSRIDKAKVVPFSEYDHEQVCIGEDDFHPVEEWQDDGEPPWAWACVSVGVPRLDAWDILNAALEEMHEEAIEDLDVDGLQAALDAWVGQQKVDWWQSDHSRRVLLPPDSLRSAAPDESPSLDELSAEACGGLTGVATDLESPPDLKSSPDEAAS